MTVVKGDIRLVTNTPAAVSQVWVRAPKPRTQGLAYVSESSDTVPVTGGVVEFNALPGAAVMVLVQNGVPTDTVKLIVPDKETSSLRECIDAVGLVDDGTMSTLEQLALDVAENVARIGGASQIDEWVQEAQNSKWGAAEDARLASSEAGRATREADRAKTAAQESESARDDTGNLKQEADQSATRASEHEAAVREFADNLPTILQTELSTQVPPIVPPLVPPLVADALASDRAVADAAAAAVAAANTDLVITLHGGEDLKTLSPGPYWVPTATTARSLINRPETASVEAASMIVITKGPRNANRIDWTTFQAAGSGLSGTWSTQQDTAGEWAPWRRTDMWAENRSLVTGEDIFSLTTAGVYTAHDLTAATSMINRPTDPDALGAAIVEVIVHPRGMRKIRWHSLQNAASGLSGTWTAQQDTAGKWTAWNRMPVERGDVPAGSDIRELGEGDWKVYSSITANSLVNAPPQPQSRDTSLITVRRGGRDRKIVTWAAMRPASGGDAYSFQTHQDSGGTWSKWTQIWPIESQVPTPPEVTEATTPTLSRAMWDYHLGMRRAQLDSAAGEPLWGWAATEGAELTIPTHERSGQACHPSVVHIPDGWNGYRYWMAMTPYPSSAEEHEDPNIISSHDGTTWEVPEGLTNPLDDQDGRPNAHNSDTYLNLGADGVMRVIWRTVDRPNNNHNYFYMRTSTDGVTWTPKQVIYDTSGTEVSPTITWTGTAWRMYYCRSGILYYRETTDLDTPAWSNFVTCTTELPPGPGRSWWHMDIQYAGGTWWCLMQDRRVGDTLHGDIYLWRSQDGKHWDNSPVPIIPRVGDNYDSVYKSAVLIDGTGREMSLDVFYSTYAHATREWAIRRTTAEWIN